MHDFFNSRNVAFERNLINIPIDLFAKFSNFPLFFLLQITIECDHGYDLSKQVTTTCKSGDWDIEKFPFCIPSKAILLQFSLQ